jgi:hypothetical protein
VLPAVAFLSEGVAASLPEELPDPELPAPSPDRFEPPLEEDRASLR